MVCTEVIHCRFGNRLVRKVDLVLAIVLFRTNLLNAVIILDGLAMSWVGTTFRATSLRKAMSLRQDFSRGPASCDFKRGA